jgi:hypothetical protein
LQRRVAGLLAPGERISDIENLGLHGAWLLSDHALYVLQAERPPMRIPLQEIRSVESNVGRITAVLTTTRDEVVTVAVTRPSVILQSLEARSGRS